MSEWAAAGDRTVDKAIDGEASWQRREAASLSDYMTLLKPRVMSLVIFTAFVGMAIAPVEIHPVLGFAALLCIAIGAGASGALNMVYDADIDRIMQRTKSRPIPAGRVEPSEARAFGVTLSGFSVLTLGLIANWLAAALLAFTIFFYVVIYTLWLKRWTPQNIVIGGAAGAFPPVVGWVAATGSISIEPILLFLIIFVWTPPHFWALALLSREDYARAGVPMLPVVAGDHATRKQILAYTILLAPLGVSPVLFDMAGWLYGSVSAAAGLAFIGLSWRVYRRGSDETAARDAKNLFGYSILYLFLLFSLILMERWLGIV